MPKNYSITNTGDLYLRDTKYNILPSVPHNKNKLLKYNSRHLVIKARIV
ncbi:hypothetical protein BH11BAC1_BH11BAC1_12620 [soil metagenome]